MAQLKNEQAYKAAMARIDALLPLVTDETSVDDPNYLELDMLSDMVAEYEDVHYPIGVRGQDVLHLNWLASYNDCAEKSISSSKTSFHRTRSEISQNEQYTSPSFWLKRKNSNVPSDHHYDSDQDIETDISGESTLKRKRV